MSEGNDATTNVNNLALPDLPVPGEGADDLEMPLDLPDAAPAWMAALSPSLGEPEADFPSLDAPADPPSDVVEPAPVTLSPPRFDALKEHLASRLQHLDSGPPPVSEAAADLPAMSQSNEAQAESSEEPPTEPHPWATDSQPLVDLSGQDPVSIGDRQAEPILEIPSRTFEFQAPAPVPEMAELPMEAGDSAGQSDAVEALSTTIELRSVESSTITDEPPVDESQPEPESNVSEPAELAPEGEGEVQGHGFEMPDTLPEALESLAQDEIEPATGSSLEEVIADIDRQSTTAVETPELPQVQTVQSGSTTARERHVVFSLADAKYAIPIANVIEMGRIPPITAVPYLPEWVRGVMNLRGDILSVIDFRTFIDLPALEQSRTGRLLVVRSKQSGVTTGLIVDEVNGMRELATDSLKPVTAAIGDQILRFLRGLSVQEDGLLVVLDLESVLSAAEIRVS